MRRRRKKSTARRPPGVKRAKPERVDGHTAAGEPGAEYIPSGEVTTRHAAGPLKPEVKQKSADHGLFWDEGKEINLVDQVAVFPQVESTTASVSSMITQQQKEKLRGLGYSEERIREMKPEDAQAILKEGIKAS
jgi:uncharacterized protein (DUF58 family)